MSTILIRAALETALIAMSAGLDTALENDKHTPPSAGTPYQRVTVRFARPDNIENTASYRQDGFMQVDLFYPQDAGPGDAMERAELIRSTFRRTASFSSGGVTTTIFRTPEILPGMNDGDRFHVPVRVEFYAHITV